MALCRGRCASREWNDGVLAGIHLRLVIEQAGWHGAEEVAVPEGITLVSLASYSPELQLAEHLWAPIDEAVANRTFASLEEIEAVLGDRIRALAERPEQIRSTTLFRWWPTGKNE